MTMFSTMLTATAALAFTMSGANAQFLLGSGANDNKEVTNLYAGEREIDRGQGGTFRGGSNSLAWGAPLGADASGDKRVVPNDGDRLDGNGTFRGGGSGLSVGAPLGGGVPTKRVVGER